MFIHTYSTWLGDPALLYVTPFVLYIHSLVNLELLQQCFQYKSYKMTNNTNVYIFVLFSRRIMSECRLSSMNWKAAQRRLNWVGVNAWCITYDTKLTFITLFLIPAAQISIRVRAILVMKLLTECVYLHLTVAEKAAHYAFTVRLHIGSDIFIHCSISMLLTHITGSSWR